MAAQLRFALIGLLFVALVLNFLVSVSLPYITILDVVRTDFPESIFQSDKYAAQIRFGVWAYCSYNKKDEKFCSPTHHGYEYMAKIDSFENSGSYILSIGSSWTRGLAVHPVATGITAIAFATAFNGSLTAITVCLLSSLLAAALTLIAFAIDIALLAYTRHKFEDSNLRGDTKTAAGFWMTFVSLICLLAATWCVWRENRIEKSGSARYPSTQSSRPWYSRWRGGAGKV